MAGHLLRPPDLTMLPENERPAVLRALAKRPTDRWPSCRAFVAEVAKAVGMGEEEEVGIGSLTQATQTVEKTSNTQHGIPIPQPTQPPRKDLDSIPSQRNKKRTLLAAAIVIGLVALAGSIALFLQRSQVTYLVDLTPQNFDGLAFEPWCNKAVHGTQTLHGLGVHPRDKSWAYVAYDLNKRFQVFKTTAAIADSVNNGKLGEDVGPLPLR
jgi:hypothetical protein